MKYETIFLTLIILFLLIIPADAYSKTAPYTEIPTQHSGNWPNQLLDLMDVEFIQANHNERIRQNGTIYQIRFAIANASELIEFYFTIWRKNETNGGYDRIAMTENLRESIVDGINEIDLSIDPYDPIEDVHEGDYYGYHIKTSGNSLYINTYISPDDPHFTYYVNGGASSIINYDWESQQWRTFIFVIEPYMDNPYMIFIGDSIIAGHRYGDNIFEHFPFIEYKKDLTNISTTIENQWSKKVDGMTYQNMGYGGQKIEKINGRFNSDVVDLSPKFALMEGGVNDVSADDFDEYKIQGVLDEWELMIEKAHDNDLTPIVMLILPWTTGSNEQSRYIDIINEELIHLAAEYSPSIIVDARSYVGIHRNGGDEGNLWDINPIYTFDGCHYYPAGNERIAQAIKDSFKFIYGKPGLCNLIRPDGTIIYSTGLSNAINTSWRMASTSSTASVHYNAPSLDEIANFTINSGTIDWISIYNQSQDQVYNLRHSNGILIESSTLQNGIVNFTISEELSSGTYFIDNDTIPPASITNLYNTTGQTWINWTWDNPVNRDFNHTIIYLNGDRKANISSPFFNATGLNPDMNYEIGTHTVDFDGNVNNTWINQTSRTLTQKGDLDGDGNITSADVQIALTIVFNGEDIPEADVDGNGYVNILDVRMIMRNVIMLV